ncbi:fumarylacetoacetate hydrolase family protein [Actinoplanes sp. NPDC051851]|uniref:fumarylacetoacetate hydrolase family protein n=1 Tax=Actinoplanes sp. NPDC051851 TaxID=3154753 RepID=UPI003415E344
MRIARFSYAGTERVGLVEGESVRPLPAGATVLGVASGSVPEATEPIVPLAEVTLLAPVQPVAVRDFVSFQRHVEGAKRAVEGEAGVPDAWFEQPTFLFLNPHSIIGTGEPVAPPYGCRELDFELEVAAIIGRDGRDLTPEEAAGHIAGYAVLNDWSARDLQGREMKMGLGPAKGKDFATTLGPWLTTPDELAEHDDGDRLRLRMAVSINGTEVGSDDLGTMAWSFPELVAYASRSAWIRAGDVIASGTCANGSLVEVWGRVGKREPAPLSEGDEVTMTVTGLGSVTNVVGAPRPEASPIPKARRL